MGLFGGLANQSALFFKKCLKFAYEPIKSKCVAYPPYTGDKRLVLEGLISTNLHVQSGL